MCKKITPNKKCGRNIGNEDNDYIPAHRSKLVEDFDTRRMRIKYIMHDKKKR